MKHKKRFRSGFTIVELLVVIVVIGILASITIVAYNGLSQRAKDASLQSDLAQAKKQIETFNAVNGSYPTANNCPTPGDGQICLKTSPGNTLTYTPNNTTNPTSYTLTGNSGVALGSSAAAVATSCQAIQQTGNTTSGTYWVNLPTVGATQVYCLLDSTFDGGGWMMAMKATRGATFTYSSSYWTAANTLNTTSTNTSDGDSKFNSFNYFLAKDLLAIFPDMTNGGSVSSSKRGWTWLQNNFSSGNRTTLLSLFSGSQSFISTAFGYSGFGSPWSSQSGMTWYGFNYTQNPYGFNVRWGFAFNNEADHSSNDVTGGIGVGYPGYSAGDAIYCCPSQTGINRSARVEIYVR